MAPNVRKTEFSDAAMLGFNLSQASVADPKRLQNRHRSNLRDRFIKGGVEAVNDIELLELILFRAIPNRDIRLLCQLLLKQFGSFNNVLAAAPSDLRKIKGIGIAVINELKIIRAAAHKMAQLDVIERDVISSWDQLIVYCRSSMAHLKQEQFRALFLDSKNVLITDECLQTGIVNHVPVYPRQVAKRALECDATAVILVHNHPSGDPEPSQSDIDVTHEIIDALGALKIAVHDHLIIGAAGDISFKARGLI
ncbi:JAB domain-containing protein [Amylibacter sp. SFDW26]|uniref:RadC family protein n=1 Tax=Amylibacter sp. SFDW26 TaxID=2652722 RepID=UPI00126217CB|nr:DNA repair protein RadC [Amylibacter sp. SFDW26]KAB7614595.1 JAB domain-containing protein [Amylibacter sp. SFDW26]